jgi:hypothetical protein
MFEYIDGRCQANMCWHENGTKWRESLPFTNHLGVGRMWDPSGGLIAEGIWKNDKPWSGTFPESWAAQDGDGTFHCIEGERVESPAHSNAQPNVFLLPHARNGHSEGKH